MSSPKRKSRQARRPANDKSPGLLRVINRLEPNLPICVEEIEVFDQLIASLGALAANDDFPVPIES